jgi:sugar O-acyltransferase (sialic acid O-acetyltransferase NeuD family)
MYIYGAGGHAKVVIDILESSKVAISGLFDNKKANYDFLNYQVHAVIDGVISPLIIAIGDNKTRKKVAHDLLVEFGKAVHSTAIISDRASIGEGTVVMQGAIVQSCSHIGKHCIINTGSAIDHDCEIEDFVHISPHTTLCGNVSVGEGSWIGAGATIIQGIKIGRWSVIGAGSVVVKDVPDNVLAYGNPCKIVKYLDVK